jgi:hypothetical protein
MPSGLSARKKSAACKEEYEMNKDYPSKHDRIVQHHDFNHTINVSEQNQVSAVKFHQQKKFPPSNSHAAILKLL